MLDAVIGMQGEDGSGRVRGVLARPGRDHHAGWHVLARFGRAAAGQCQALASWGCVPLASLCCRDARGHEETTRERPGRWVPKVAGMALFGMF
jgi:hypothetical protein